MCVQRQLIAAPRPTGPRVQRAALLRRLESAAEPLVLLVAPSGFGKTSLLEQWAATTGGRGGFGARFPASLAARWPGAGNDAALIVARPSWDDPQLADSLARDLAEIPAPAAVVINDAQFGECEA